MIVAGVASASCGPTPSPEVDAVAVESAFMPLKGPPSNVAQKTLLIGWLDAGVPLSTANCN